MGERYYIKSSGVRTLLPCSVTKSTQSKNMHRWLVHSQTLLLVTLSMLSRNTSVQIDTVMSPLTLQIPLLIPRLQNIRRRKRKIAESLAKVLKQAICILELEVYRTLPIARNSARAILKS